MLMKTALVVILACGLMGCGGGSDEPVRFQSSGAVTFDGKPIPAGDIFFMPDGSKDNKGAPGFAKIVDGKYDTSAEGGKGHVGGPMIVKIEGQDPAAQGKENSKDTSGEEVIKSLFPPYETTADLPKEDGTKDFAVPAEAANKVINSENTQTPGGV